MFGGSSQFPTTAERAVIKSLSTIQTTKQCSAVVGSWEEPPSIWLTVAENPFVGWTLNFRVRMLLKGAVIIAVSLCKIWTSLYNTSFITFFFKVAPPETIGDLALAISSSPSKNYFFVIFATCLALIFVCGLVFGRLFKRIRKEVKDR